MALRKTNRVAAFKNITAKAAKRKKERSPIPAHLFDNTVLRNSVTFRKAGKYSTYESKRSLGRPFVSSNYKANGSLQVLPTVNAYRTTVAYYPNEGK